MRATPKCFSLCLLAGAALAHEAPAARPLTLEQIFGPAAVTGERPPSIRWLARGAAYTTIEQSEVVRYDTATATRTVVVGMEKPVSIEDHQWSSDERLVLLTVAPGPEHWLYDVTTRTLRRIGADLPAGSLLHPEFSPDSTHLAYVSGNNLRVESVDGSQARALTTDGDDLVINGRGDLAYEEEFGISKAFAWSPDSRRIAYWRFDTSGVGVFQMIRNTDGQYPTTVPLRYPKPGTMNSAVRVGVVPIDTGSTTWFALAGDARDNYVPRMDWAGDSAEVLIQYENRRQNTKRVLLANAASGAAREIMVERDEAWLLPSDDVHWLDGGRAFTWLSERDGWMHLYVVSRDGRRAQLRTPGKFDVVRIVRVDEAAGYAYFIAASDDVKQRFLYRATLRGAPRLTRLTPAGERGWHDYDLAPGAAWALHTWSAVDTPPATGLVRLPAHEPARTLSRNERMRTLLAGTPRAATEFFQLEVDGGMTLDAWMLKPPDFDPAKKYPLLMYVYSEPAGQTVVDRWGGERHLWHLMLAQQGYIVASVDSRGAAAPRGHDWRRSIYRQIGILASADQAAAVRKMLATRPYLDPARVGIWGWSGGGAMTLNALFRYPQLYKTGMAIASPTDQLLYNSIYQERYMGLPVDNPAGYRDGSPINFADRLAGHLLIVHGTGDDNVHYQNAEQLVDRLIGLNKQFSLMIYPNRTHGISEGANTRLHLFDLLTAYLHQYLPAGDAR